MSGNQTTVLQAAVKMSSPQKSKQFLETHRVCSSTHHVTRLLVHGGTKSNEVIYLFEQPHRQHPQHSSETKQTAQTSVSRRKQQRINRCATFSTRSETSSSLPHSSDAHHSSFAPRYTVRVNTQTAQFSIPLFPNSPPQMKCF